jgi:hypothetical protein
MVLVFKEPQCSAQSSQHPDSDNYTKPDKLRLCISYVVVVWCGAARGSYVNWLYHGIIYIYIYIYICVCVYLFIQLHTAAFEAYCAILVRRSNFRHQASPRVSLRESTQRRKVELWAKNVRKFCLSVDFHVTFRDLLHAVKRRHGTDGFTLPPKEGVMRIFFSP